MNASRFLFFIFVFVTLSLSMVASACLMRGDDCRTSRNANQCCRGQGICRLVNGPIISYKCK